MKATYIAPKVTVVGSLEELTLTRSKAPGSPHDGDKIGKVFLYTVSGGP